MRWAVGLWQTVRYENKERTHARSDTPKCFDLVDPVIVKDQFSLLPLTDLKGTTLLHFWDYLLDEGCCTRPESIAHKDLTQFFDSRRVQSKRLYLLCLTSLEKYLAVNKEICFLTSHKVTTSSF